MTLLEPDLRALERGRRAIVQAKHEGQKHTFGRGPGCAFADSSILFDYQTQGSATSRSSMGDKTMPDAAVDGSIRTIVPLIKPILLPK